MFAELMRAPLSRLVMFLCVISLCSCPGALAIWICDASQFHSFNSFQLILLSISLILPFILVNACIVSWSFGLHRWYNRRFRNRRLRAPREAIVAAASVFAGALGSVIPAYAPIIFHVLHAKSDVRGMVEVALIAELIPLAALFLINPINYWQGGDDQNPSVPDASPKKFEVELKLHMDDVRQALAQSSTPPTSNVP